MSVTYLMQYRVQYIIAPVLFRWVRKVPSERRWLVYKHEKGQSRIDINFFLWPPIGPCIQVVTELLCRCSSHPLMPPYEVTWISSMPQSKLCMPFYLIYRHLSLVWAGETSINVPSVQVWVFINGRLFGLSHLADDRHLIKQFIFNKKK